MFTGSYINLTFRYDYPLTMTYGDVQPTSQDTYYYYIPAQDYQLDQYLAFIIDYYNYHYEFIKTAPISVADASWNPQNEEVETFMIPVILNYNNKYYCLPLQATSNFDNMPPSDLQYLEFSSIDSILSFMYINHRQHLLRFIPE